MTTQGTFALDIEATTGGLDPFLDAVAAGLDEARRQLAALDSVGTLNVEQQARARSLDAAVAEYLDILGADRAYSQGDDA